MTQLQISLRNGTMTLPQDTGTFVISTGCGSGKTYWLERFIQKHSMDGMLIVVDSIVSANTMYKDLVSLNVDEDDILMIHSQMDYQTQNDYAQNPQMATMKKVLIMTNVRLYTEYPPVYLLYNKNGVKLAPFDGDWVMLMNNPDVRRWIIIDEIPGFIQEFAEVSKLHMGVLSESDGHAGYTAKGEAEMKNAYSTFIRNSGYDFFDGSTTLGKLRNESVLAIIKREHHRMMKDKGKSAIQFSPCDFYSTKSLVLIMEGAGDILFKDSHVYKLEDKADKYTGKSTFKKLHVPKLKRRERDQKMMIDEMAKSIVAVMSVSKGKTLIVCWKDFKGDNDADKENSDSPLVDMLNNELYNTSLLKDDYSIIYYGSSDSRAVNTYKDYSNIILLGKWSLPPSSSYIKFNKAFKTKTTYTRYILWEYVQLITRTRIRLGMDINVHYTDDHDEDFIRTLDKYLNLNTLDIPEEQDDWRDKVKEVKYGKKQLNTIELLTQRFPFLPDVIKGGNKSKEIDLTLKDLNNLLGKERKMRDYEPLVNVLKQLGIILKIVK